MGEILTSYRTRVAAGVLDANPAQQAAATRLDGLADALASWKPNSWFHSAPPRGMYLWGSVGAGKSMLLDLFYERAPIDAKARVHFHAFMLSQHAFMREARAKRDDAQDDLIAQAAKHVAEETRLLCFDELQITDIADAMILGRLFEQLFQRNVVVVATGNRPPQDFYKNGLNRQLFTPFIALFEAKLDIVQLDAGRDYRLERLLAAPVYQAPLGAKADREMDAAWERLTHGAVARTATLEVQGRMLEISRTAAGCARFTFSELCDRPLGPADYLEIAERFHTILIDHVPLLTPDNREQAARFRTLIDALYEAKTKLICSAAAEPADLYPAGVQAFEFERTASRLMEMRSKDYLAAPRRDAEFKSALRET